MYKNSLQNTTHIDFGRETWIKSYLKYFSQLCFSGSASRDRSIQVKDDMKTGRWDLVKGDHDHDHLIEVTAKQWWKSQ